MATLTPTQREALGKLIDLTKQILTGLHLLVDSEEIATPPAQAGKKKGATAPPADAPKREPLPKAEFDALMERTKPRYSAEALAPMNRNALLQAANDLGLDVKGRTPADIRTMILQRVGLDPPEAVGETFECEVTGDSVPAIYGAKTADGTSYRVGPRVHAALKKGAKLDDLVNGTDDIDNYDA